MRGIGFDDDWNRGAPWAWGRAWRVGFGFGVGLDETGMTESLWGYQGLQ